MSLIDAPINLKLILHSFKSGKEAKRRLNHIGLHEDDRLIKINDNKWGPILIENISNGTSKIALDRGIAEKIIVEYEN